MKRFLIWFSILCLYAFSAEAGERRGGALADAAYELQFEPGYLTDPAVNAAESRLMAAAIFQASLEGASEKSAEKILTESFIRKLDAKGITPSEFAHEVLENEFDDTREVNAAAGFRQLTQSEEKRANALLDTTVRKTGATLPEKYDDDATVAGEAAPKEGAPIKVELPPPTVVAAASPAAETGTILERARRSLANSSEMSDEQAIMAYTRMIKSAPPQGLNLFERAHQRIGLLGQSKTMGKAAPARTPQVVDVDAGVVAAVAPAPSPNEDWKQFATSRSRRKVLAAVFAAEMPPLGARPPRRATDLPQ